MAWSRTDTGLCEKGSERRLVLPQSLMRWNQTLRLNRKIYEGFGNLLFGFSTLWQNDHEKVFTTTRRPY